MALDGVRLAESGTPFGTRCSQGNEFRALVSRSTRPGRRLVPALLQQLLLTLPLEKVSGEPSGVVPVGSAHVAPPSGDVVVRMPLTGSVVSVERCPPKIARRGRALDQQRRMADRRVAGDDWRGGSEGAGLSDRAMEDVRRVTAAAPTRRAAAGRARRAPSRPRR
jgi:hypothetical protein